MTQLKPLNLLKLFYQVTMGMYLYPRSRPGILLFEKSIFMVRFTRNSVESWLLAYITKNITLLFGILKWDWAFEKIVFRVRFTRNSVERWLLASITRNISLLLGILKWDWVRFTRNSVKRWLFTWINRRLFRDSGAYSYTFNLIRLVNCEAII